MLKIGLDKTDKTYRHFEYDDERKYGNPQVYKVLYEETGEFGEILCSNVISIKKSNSIKNHFLDIPIYNDNIKDTKSKPTQITVVNEKFEDVKEIKPSEVVVEKKKTKSSKPKVKTKSTQLTDKPIENKTTTLDVVQTLPKSYEYDILVIDSISNIMDIKCELNELGKDGWEVCGFQIIQKIFGECQALIIIKKGLN